MNNEVKNRQLGMPFGTASNRLRKMVLFDLLRKHGENICFRCGKEIETYEELSLEHKQPWLNVDATLFWDLGNIAFSHLNCNCSTGKRMDKLLVVHGTFVGYTHYGCRCPLIETTEENGNRGM